MLPCMGKKTVNFETFSWKGPEAAAAAGWLALVHADYRLWLPRMEMMSITREKFPELLSSFHTMKKVNFELHDLFDLLGGKNPSEATRFERCTSIFATSLEFPKFVCQHHQTLDHDFKFRSEALIKSGS